MASAALDKIAQTKQNNYFLRQIRKEETKLYFSRANEAMRNKNYSLASQLLSRYRENVSQELDERKMEREQISAKASSSDATLVGKLVDELDKAKKA
jgi:sulfur relay (sulfurtransferase) DsrF/TusC family protein